MQKSLGFDVSFFILGARQSSVGGGAGWRFSGGKALIQPGGQDQGLEPETGKELKTVLVWMLLLVESSGESFSRLGGSTVLEQVWVLLRADLHAGTETQIISTQNCCYC